MEFVKPDLDCLTAYIFIIFKIRTKGFGFTDANMRVMLRKNIHVHEVRQLIKMHENISSNKAEPIRLPIQ